MHTLEPSLGTAAHEKVRVLVDGKRAGTATQWYPGGQWRAFHVTAGHHAFDSREEAISYIVAGRALPGSVAPVGRAESAPRRESEGQAKTNLTRVTTPAPAAPAEDFETTFTRIFEQASAGLAGGN